MEQFSETTEKRLEELERQLAKADKERKDAQAAYEKLFAAVFSLFDAEGWVDKPARYIATSGMVVERRISDPEERINPEKVKAEVDAKTWTRITDAGPRVLNQRKLIRAIQSGVVPAQVVERALEKPAGIVSRHYRAASKEDKQWLELQAVSKAAPKQLAQPDSA